MVLDLLGEDTLFKQSDVRETPSATVELAAQLSPIGSVVAWLKTYTNTPALPAGWVECDGTAINDADSVYNGQNSPDLNGDNRFLKGNSTSGTTATGSTSTSLSGGSTGSSRIDTNFVGRDADGALGVITAGGTNVSTVDYTTNSFVAEPPSYTVVWIMRIK